MEIESNFSTIWLALLALVFGLAMLVAGGDLLIAGSTKLAARLGMSPLLIGLTVVAFGTSMPELFVSITASMQGHQEIMLGNVVGSNIANIGLVLALSALLYPLSIEYRRLSLEFILVIVAGLLVMGAAYAGFFQRALGVVFVLGLIVYTVYSYKVGHGNATDDLDSPFPGVVKILWPYSSIVTLCFSGLVLLGVGSSFFIDGAVDVARFYGVSDLVIGLTLAAVGTSLPELASSISAIRKKEGDILVGNILGSNLFNLLLVLGITGAISPFSLPKSALVRDLPVMMAFTVFLVPVAIHSQKIRRHHGAMLLAGYCLYVYILS